MCIYIYIYCIYINIYYIYISIYLYLSLSVYPSIFYLSMNRPKFREDVTCAKTLIEKTWNEKYRSRNDLFWRHHRNKRPEKLYSSKLLKENPCIP